MLIDFRIAQVRIAWKDETAGGGMVSGTPGFASPEQLAGKPADGRSNVFSVGAMLYWLLVGPAPLGLSQASVCGGGADPFWGAPKQNCSAGNRIEMMKSISCCGQSDDNDLTRGVPLTDAQAIGILDLSVVAGAVSAAS